MSAAYEENAIWVRDKLRRAQRLSEALVAQGRYVDACQALRATHEALIRALDPDSNPKLKARASLAPERPPAGRGGFLVFAGDVRYARGGWHDLQDSLWTESAARELAEKLVEDRKHARFEWAHVIDLHTGKIVHEIGRAEC